MDKAISIDLNTNVEVGEEHIIVPGDKASFQKKNTEKYLGLLSNMKSKSGDGWMTTTNKEIKLVSDNGSVAVLDINGKQYSIDSSTKLIAHYEINPTISGEIKSVIADTTRVYYILKDKLNNWWHVVYNNSTKTTEREQLITTGSQYECFILYSSLNYAVASSTDVFIYDEHGEEIKHIEITQDKAPNNGWWQDEDNWVIGRNDDDAYYAWADSSISGTVWHYKYMGCIDERGYITGEPIPVSSVSGSNITYMTPTRLSNGILKWNRLNNQVSQLLQAVSSIDYTRWDFSTIADYKALVASRGKTSILYPIALSPVSFGGFVTMIRRGTVDTLNGSVESGVVGITFTNRWVYTDPGATPGVFWTTSVTEYDNVFPMKYWFTNKQANRGVTFDYGKGWTRTYELTAAIGSATSNNMDIFDVYSLGSNFYENIGGTITRTSLDANNNSTAKVYTSSYGLPITTPTELDEAIFIDSTVFNGNARRHPFTSAQYNNKAWSQWYWQIGGTDANNLIDNIPLSVPYGDFQQLVYSGYTIGFSYKKCLINTPSKEIDNWTFYNDGTNFIISTGENVYIIGSGQLKIHKIADYIFATNCITEWNTIQETRDGVVNIIRAFIPYNMSMKLSPYWGYNDFKAPADGSGPNSIWMTGAGINVNLDDKYLATSFLLPAIQIPIYVSSGDLNTFNKNIMSANFPILTPKTDLLYSDEELLVYYTHTQASTDIVYRMTVKGTDQYFDPLLEDNSWWVSSSTVYFPVGIGSTFSGINYMSSTINLEGNYTARLYVNNNQAYLTFNIAEQVYYGSTIFTIYTNNYYYDGEAIYSIIQGGNEFVCYAIGLKFLGNSGTEAYFYSPYDKAIYLFSGSNTLSKVRSLAKMGNIIDSMFSSVNQRMYILDDNSTVLWLSNESSGIYHLSNIDHMESSEKGAIFVGDNTWMIYSPKEDDYDTIVPMELETSWIGDNTSLQKFGYATVQLYSQQPNACEFELAMMVKDGTDIKQSIKKVSIKKSDWKGNYLRIRATPEFPNGQAFKFILNSNDYIHVMNIEFAYQQVSATPSPTVSEIAV